MTNPALPIQIDVIQKRIHILRGRRAMLDLDLAILFGVTTKRLNEQVKRNRSRFPEDFMFQLTKQEKEEVVANCDHLIKLKFSAVLPHAFTEHGVIMAANVLRSQIAAQASIQVVRVFVQLRDMLISNKGLSKRLDELEKKYDAQFRAVFQAVRELMDPARSPRKPIGFGP